jgi:AraC-like DNA-binding protein
VTALSNGESKALRRKVAVYLRTCFRDATTPRVKELAAYLGMSRATLAIQFVHEYRVSPGKYLRQVQIKRAKLLLGTTTVLIAVIARQTLFSSVRSFHRAFRRDVGITPAEYRR